MRCFVLASALLLTGCAADPLHVMASTPSMVSVCGGQKLSDAVQLAQNECARSHKNATLIGHGGQCIASRDTMSLERGEELDFRCE